MKISPLSVVVGGAMATAIVGNALSNKNEESQLNNVLASSLTAGGISLGVGYFTGRNEIAQQTRVATFFATSIGLGIKSDLDEGKSVTAAITSNTLAATAGLAAYHYGKSEIPKGFAVLRSYLEKKSADNILTRATEMYGAALRKTPQLGAYLNKTTVGLGAAVATIPIAHSLIQRAFVSHSRNGMAVKDLVHQGHQAHSQAGDRGDRVDMAGSAPADSSIGEHTVTFNTTFNRDNLLLASRLL
mgnify:CR=1 FL=1